MEILSSSSVQYSGNFLIQPVYWAFAFFIAYFLFPRGLISLLRRASLFIKNIDGSIRIVPTIYWYLSFAVTFYVINIPFFCSLILEHAANICNWLFYNGVFYLNPTLVYFFILLVCVKLAPFLLPFPEKSLRVVMSENTIRFVKLCKLLKRWGTKWSARIMGRNAKTSAANSYYFEAIAIQRTKLFQTTHIVPQEGMNRSERLYYVLISLIFSTIAIVATETNLVESGLESAMRSLAIDFIALSLLFFLIFNPMPKKYRLFGRNLKVHYLTDMYQASLRADSVGYSETRFDPIIMRQLRIMLTKGYNYPSNWQLYVWDFSKLILSYAVTKRLFYADGSSRLAHPKKLYFYLLLLSPLFTFLVVLLFSPIKDYLLFNSIQTQELRDLKIGYLFAGVSFVCWASYMYLQLTHYQIWHYVSHSKVKAGFVVNYQMGDDNFTDAQRRAHMDAIRTGLLGQGDKVVKISCTIFLPIYVSFLGLLN